MVAQVHARHILLETNAIEDDDTVRQKLTQFRDRILGGEAFDAIAAVNSADPGSAARGEQKRAKYQDESTKVSKVSVSRRAGLPQQGQATCFQLGWWSSGLPGLEKSTSSGSTTGS
jgi:hypothetical protein